MFRWLPRAMVAGLVFLCISGCSTPGPVTGCPDEPKWVSKGSGTFPEKKGKAIYAVGMAEYDANEAAQRVVAEQNARVELASQLQTYVAAMLKEFMESHKDLADPSSSSSIVFAQSVSRSVTAATLHDSRMQDSWRHCDGKRLYMLFTMPLGEALKQARDPIMQKAKEEAAGTFESKAAAALQELDAEIQKRQRLEGGGK